jgi:uncharacterized protein (TIGR02246 family)
MAVTQAFNDASNANDVERVLDLFADDAVIQQVPPAPPPGPSTWTGKQQIREWFEPQLQNLNVASRNMQLNGDTVTWNATLSGDMFRQMGVDTFDVTAETVVRGGKIVSFTVTQPPETVSKFEKAMAQGGAGQGG